MKKVYAYAAVVLLASVTCSTAGYQPPTLPILVGGEKPLGYPNAYSVRRDDLCISVHEDYVRTELGARLLWEPSTWVVSAPCPM